MSRIPALDPAQAQGKTKENLAAVNAMLGATPNLFRVAAQAPAVLEALAGMFGALGKGELRASTREAIALTVAEANGCDYCLSAHTVLGRAAGLSDADLAAARKATSSTPKTAALLDFARAIVSERGRVGEGAVDSVRKAGATDAELVEVVGHVALNVFTNYLNLVAQTEIDFPVVRAAGR